MLTNINFIKFPAYVLQKSHILCEDLLLHATQVTLIYHEKASNTLASSLF